MTRLRHTGGADHRRRPPPVYIFISLSKAGRDWFGVRNAPPRSLQHNHLGLLSTRLGLRTEVDGGDQVSRGTRAIGFGGSGNWATDCSNGTHLRKVSQPSWCELARAECHAGSKEAQLSLSPGTRASFARARGLVVPVTQFAEPKPPEQEPRTTCTRVLVCGTASQPRSESFFPDVTRGGGIAEPPRKGGRSGDS